MTASREAFNKCMRKMQLGGSSFAYLYWLIWKGGVAFGRKEKR